MGRSGDWTTFDRLVVEHLPAALAFALRLTGDPDLAEEVVQVALERAWRGWQTFRGEAKFKTWLFAIVVNAFRDQLARRPIGGPLPDELCDDRQADPAAAAAAAELSQMIARLISMLPPRQREVLVLTTYEGLSTSEVAAVLGISPANVHSTLHLARARLRRQLAPYLAEK